MTFINYKKYRLNIISYIFFMYLQIDAGDNAFFEFILKQVARPTGYTCGHFRKQIVVFMAENTTYFTQQTKGFLK